MDKKLHIKYETKEERIEAWKENRAIYTKWRKTEEAHLAIERFRKKQFNLCFICLKELDKQIHIDHIFPLYLGGTNYIGNLCITHPACNMLKGVEVTSTFKQACRKRKAFNDLQKCIKFNESKNKPRQMSKKMTNRFKRVQKIFPELIVKYQLQ